MDGQGGRGAYAQVTAPIGEDGQVTVKPSGKSRGASSVCTAKRLGIAVVIVIVIIVIIIVAVVASKKSSSSSEITSANTTTIAASVTSMMGAATQSTLKSVSAMTTTQPTPAPTTFGPPVRGSFTGAIVLNTPYLRSYDDVRAQGTDELMTNFTQAVSSDTLCRHKYMVFM
nr:uncharacterized protein LOC129271435 isoform X1 [Lytechinus pictus]XP_054764852.1 uncharacterized protein LOC129271435 isoform X1 [Lytechinus pictus]